MLDPTVLCGRLRAASVSVGFVLLLAVGMIYLPACNPRLTTHGISGAASNSVLFIPASAHVTGAQGTNWRTDIEAYNPGSTQAAYTLELLERDKGNASPAARSFTLAPGRSVRYEDALDSLFHFTGAAALRISVTAGLATFTSRTFNQTAGGTYGQFIGGVLEGTAIPWGKEARIVQLAHNRSSSSGFRTNIGFVNATGSSLALRVDLYLADGSHLGSRSYNLEPYEFRQIDKIFEKVTGSDVMDGYAVLTTSTAGGSFFAYASVVDNRTGDPVFITPSVRPTSGTPPPAPSVTPTATATPTSTSTATPTPTPTQPASHPNLKPYQPSGWSGPMVVSGTTNTSTSAGLVGGQPTYFDWAVGNYGPGDAVFPPGSNFTQIQLDGSPVVNFLTQDGYTLPEGHYAYYLDYQVDNIQAGQHSTTLVADPDQVISEPNEGDNTYEYAGAWAAGSFPPGSIPAPERANPGTMGVAPIPGWLRHETGAIRQAAGGRPEHSLPSAFGQRTQGAQGIAVVGEAVYIPASAHVSGALGTNWRTDVELHNPGPIPATYRVDLLQRDRDNTNSESRTFTVQGGHSLRLEDVLWSQFAFSGAAALRVVPLSGEVIVTSRTFNLTPAGTYGQFIAGVGERSALAAGERAVQIQLSHVSSPSSGYRTNLGMLNITGSSITLQVDLKRADGASYGARSYTLRPYEFKQIDKLFQSVTGNIVADGYAVITSTSAVARFLAYASIIDNRTGDPVFAPAIPVLTSEPAPVDLTSAADAFFVGLGAMTEEGAPSLEQMLSGMHQVGMEGFLNGLLSVYPDVVTRIPGGIRADYGSHYVLDDGSVISGALKVTYSNLVSTPGSLAFDYTVTQDRFLWNGQYAQSESVNGSFDFSIDSGHVAGDITVNGSGEQASAPGTTAPSITGTAVFDTAICPNYPIDGSVTVTDDTGTTTINFNDRCDGSYDPPAPPTPSPTPTPTPTQPPSGDLVFRLSWTDRVDLDLVVKNPNGEKLGLQDTTCSDNDPSPEETVTLVGQDAISGVYEYWLTLWVKCEETASDTPGYTFQVYDGGVLRETHSGNLSGNESPHYTYRH